MNSDTLERASTMFSALGHPMRLRIIELLLKGSRSVSEVAAALELGQSASSQHLAVLARAGLLSVLHQGAARIYSVRSPHVQHIVNLSEELCNGLR